MKKYTMTLAVISALSASTAYAQDGNSRLQITMDKPVNILVDGRFQEVNEHSRTYLFEDLQAGRHEVSVRALFGRELANVFVDVPEASEVRCRWRRKNFECYDTIALAPVAAPIPEPAVAIAEPTPIVTVVETAPTTQVVETTTVTTTTNGLGMGEPMPNIGGSIAIAGPDGESVSIGVNLGGMGMGMDAEITETTTVTTTTHSAPVMVESHSAPMVVEAVETRAIPSSVSLIVRSTDGEWADFLVDGKVVAEFRNEEEIKVDISSGTHTIEVREFMEDKGYTRAKIDTGFASEIVVGLTEGEPIECFNHDGCYTK